MRLLSAVWVVCFFLSSVYGSLCLGGTGCNCIGGKIGGSSGICLLTFLGILAVSLCCCLCVCAVCVVGAFGGVYVIRKQNQESYPIYQGSN